MTRKTGVNRRLGVIAEYNSKYTVDPDDTCKKKQGNLNKNVTWSNFCEINEMQKNSSVWL